MPSGGTTESGPVELVGDQLAIPAQNGIRHGRGRYFLQRLTPEAVSDLRERGLVSFRKEHSALDLGFQDTVLRSQIFVPQQQFVIDGAGDVGQHASPVPSRASLKLIVEPGLYMLLRFQKAAGRGNYETGNQAFSKRLRFLTIRGFA